MNISSASFLMISIMQTPNHSSNKRIKDEKQTNISRHSMNSPNANKSKMKKRDSKTQHLLDSSKKLGRRLISMDMRSEERDKRRTGKRNQST